jgi:hypothetical protein
MPAPGKIIKRAYFGRNDFRHINRQIARSRRLIAFRFCLCALGHSSVTIAERYYAKWNKAQQDILDGVLARAWK